MLHVTSEIGRLRRVLVHAPGPEVDRMVPAMMEDLLFDDILFGDMARQEHARFRRVLQLLGVEVLDAEDLLADILSGEEARADVLDLLLDDLSAGVRERLRAAPAEELAASLVGGIRHEPGHSEIGLDDLFEIPPLPNWCFQRDPQVVVNGGVVLSSMATPARYREAHLARCLFRHHPDLAAPVLFDPLLHDREHAMLLGQHRPRLEGGDVLVLSPDLVAVGLSERTNRPGIAALVRSLARRDGAPRWLVVVEIPSRRAYMHLDTLVTPVDRDACLLFPPVLEGTGPDAARVHEIDLHAAEPVSQPCDRFLSALARRGVDLRPIPCGGPDPIAQQREQWTDGANALAVAPGTVLLYDRNVRTAEELARHGFRVLAADDLLLGRAEVDPEEPGRTCILLPSHEISRARGGPHCLSHPLVRDGAGT